MAGNLLIQRGLRRDGSERIRAGQIDQRDLMIRGRELPLFTFHGDPSPVAYALARTGQLVKQSCLAGIWITN
ncbi:hypothetical protein SDC9_197119 [bioreactor metagenome]|uniref:Uncharacterized protein n=1 Tax=bioreactor metagenome TaxID=1076179 RepID=A0A645IDV7_9ZZZZ